LKIAIITDIHEDVETLKKTITYLEKTSCDQIICLGDIVGFSQPFYTFENKRNANECVNIIRSNCSVVVAGNHDLNAVKKIPKYTKIKYPKDWFNFTAQQKRNMLGGEVWIYEDELKHNLNNENIEYLMNLNEFEIRNFDGQNIMFSHYIYPNLSGSNCMLPGLLYNLNSYFDFIENQKCSFGIFGHLHPNGILFSQKSKYKITSLFKYPFKTIEKSIKINLNTISCYTVPSLTIQNNNCVILDTSKFELTIF